MAAREAEGSLGRIGLRASPPNPSFPQSEVTRERGLLDSEQDEQSSSHSYALAEAPRYPSWEPCAHCTYPLAALPGHPAVALGTETTRVQRTPVCSSTTIHN